MKKCFKILGALLVIAAMPLLYSCEDEDDYTPVEQPSGPQAFFSPDLASQIDLSSDETSFDIGLLRADASGSISFTLNVSGETEKFDIPTLVSFADGVDSATLTIGYDPDDFEYDEYFEITLSIPEEFSTPYGLADYTFSVGLPEPWISLGYAEFCDWFFFYNENEDTQLGGYMVELQQNELHPELFRLIDPYVEGLINEEYMSNPPTDNNLNFQILQPGETLAGYTITLEDLVYFEPINPGWYYSSYASYVWLYHPAHFTNWPTEDDWTYTRVLSYQADGVTPAIVQLAPLYYLPDYGGYYDYHNYDEVVWIIFPGAQVEEPADYSVEVEYSGKYTGTNDDEYVVAEVTMGPDVEYTAVVMTEGSDPTSALYGILLDTIEYQKLTESGTVTFEAPMETGYYTVLAVSYGDGDYQYYDWDTFLYSVGEGGDVDPWVVETTGDYSFSGFYYEGSDTGLILYSNSYDETLYKIADWGAGVDFTFNWDKETNEVYVQEQGTGEAYGSYGDVCVCDVTDYFSALAPYGGTGYYSDGTFYFAIAYYCDGVDFGYGFEAFRTKGSEFGVALSDVTGSYYAFEYNAPSGSLWPGTYVIEESDDPTLGNIMLTLVDDVDCTEGYVYGTYDEKTGIAKFDNDQIYGTSGSYYLAARNYSFYRYYPITMRFFNDGAFWGPFYGDYLEIGGFMLMGGNYVHAGYFYAYEFMYGWNEDYEPSSIKPTSVGGRSVRTEPLEEGTLKNKHINFVKKPVKNSTAKLSSVAPVEQPQKGTCQPVKKATKKVVPPTPGVPNPVK